MVGAGGVPRHPRVAGGQHLHHARPHRPPIHRHLQPHPPLQVHSAGLLFQIFTSTVPQVLPTQKVWIRIPQHPHHPVCVLVCQRHQISGVPLPEDRAADPSPAHRPQALCGLQHLHEPPEHRAQHLRPPGVSPLHELQDLPCSQTTQ